MKHSLLLSIFSVSFLLAACDSGPVTSSRTPRGDPNATVVLMEFADLQCPACAASVNTVVKPIMEKYGTRIRYDYYHFPLQSIHRYALDAGMASECAADQGKFWEFVDLAFEKQKELSRDQLSVWAGELGLDTDAFDACLKGRSKRKVVLADYEKGKEMGVTGTPSFFVNGQKVESSFDALSATIEDALKQGGPRL